VEGVFWIMRSSAQWRFLPEECGSWNSVHKRYARWCDHSVWQEMHEAFANDADSDAFLEYIQAQDANAVIPSRSNRTESRDYDKHLYKNLYFAGALIWLR
jgi:transposase